MGMGLKPHTHPVHSPARPADPQIPLTSRLLCRVQGELWRNPPSQDVILLGVSFDFWQCGELELRIAEPHFARLDHVAALPRLLSNDEAEALADCTACSRCLVSVLRMSSEWWRCVCGVLGTGSSRSPRRSGIRVGPKSQAGCHRVNITRRRRQSETSTRLNLKPRYTLHALKAALLFLFVKFFPG